MKKRGTARRSLIARFGTGGMAAAGIALGGDSSSLASFAALGRHASEERICFWTFPQTSMAVFPTRAATP